MPTQQKILSITMLSLLWNCSSAQFCTSLKNDTWAGFVDAVSEAFEYGFAVLCPFEISDDGCQGIEEYPDGLRIKDEKSQLFISCDPFLYGYNTNTECVIDCSGRHLTLSNSSSLTLERMTFSGATESSIKVEDGSTLTVINSIFQDNKASEEEGKGGAIHAVSNSKIYVFYGQFVRNTANHGGALFAGKFSYVEIIESMYEENTASISGGAFAGDGYSESRFETSNFYKNEASYGGALYFKELSTTKNLDSVYESNLAIEGGAIFSAGFANVVDSTFESNAAESGGAVYIEAGSYFGLRKSNFKSNTATDFGPAVSNRFSVQVDSAHNSGCGNVVESTSTHCEGMLLLLQGARRQCDLFENICETPSSQPSSSPSTASSASQELEEPLLSPPPFEEGSNVPSDMPSMVPSGTSSIIPSDMPSLVPSDILRRVPSDVPTTS